MKHIHSNFAISYFHRLAAREETKKEKKKRERNNESQPHNDIDNDDVLQIIKWFLAWCIGTIKPVCVLRILSHLLHTAP